MRERRSRVPLLRAPKPKTEASTYEDYCLAELRAGGFRITMPRVQVIRALADTKQALSAYAIHEKIISGGGKIDVVSVYRILATLQEVGLIHHVGIVDGYFPCRIPKTAGVKSELLVDEETQSIVELALPESIYQTVEAQAKEHGYELKGVKVELIGSYVKKR